MKKYRLYYKQYELGLVTEEKSERPGPRGAIEFNKALKNFNAETCFVFDYFDYSREANDLVGNPIDEEYESFAEQQEKFSELIRSNEWYLLPEDGHKQKIATPNVTGFNEISWSYTA